MKAVIFTGTHERHLFVHKEVIKHFSDVLLIVMKREKLLPKLPSNITKHDANNFKKHFNDRLKIEKRTYGNLTIKKDFPEIEKIFVTPKNLNTFKVAKKIKEFRAKFCFIFGTGLILDPVLKILPKNKINLHLGLSPWYKGAATLFWPFYFLQPNFAGVTFHQITKNPDAGEIIHQSTPSLEYGDGIHDVGAKCLIKARLEVKKIINHFKKNSSFNGKIQKNTGRVWRESDFDPSYLRVIYDLFNNNIVDAYLKGTILKTKPKLYSCLNKKVSK